MAGEQFLLWVGNMTADPEHRTTQNGLSVANFTVASTPRTFDRQANEWKDGEASFLRCSAWRELADHIAATFTKGMRVMVYGRLSMKNYQDREGNQRTAWELEVDEVGPSLKYATAQVTRAGNGQGGGQQQAPQQGQGNYGPPQGNYGPPQGQQMAPQQGSYPAPQQQQAPPQQQPQQGYQQPPQQAPQQQVQQQPPQQQVQPMSQQPQQQPQPGAFQSPADWQQQPQQGAFGDQTPF